MISVEINKIYCMDAFELLKQMPDQSVDLILTDPPYGVNLGYDIYVDTEEHWYELMKKFIPEARRVAKMVIMPCCRIKALTWIYQNFPPDWLICWYKGSPGHRSFIGFNDWEPLLVYGKNEGVQMHDYLYAQNNERMGNYGHPCPKPIKWARWIIERATKEGDLVLDCFGGSGTILLAAKQMKRKFIGCDISQKYCGIMEERLKQDIIDLNKFV